MKFVVYKNVSGVLTEVATVAKNQVEKVMAEIRLQGGSSVVFKV